MEWNLRFKLDWARPIVGRTFTVFALYSKHKPPGGLYLEDWFNEGFFCVTSSGGFYLEGLFSQFYGSYIAVSFHLTKGTKGCHWCVVRLRSIQFTTGKRAARTKRDFRFVLSLVKPVVWFAPAVVNWSSRSVAKSAYFYMPHMRNNNLQIRIAGSLNRCQKICWSTMVMISFCVYIKYCSFTDHDSIVYTL